ncbi:hypothetical protein [Mucilaginibacter sp. RCC_168]
MKQTQFWLFIVFMALLFTWLYLLICMYGDQARLQRIENHSEIISIDTAG